MISQVRRALFGSLTLLALQSAPAFAGNACYSYCIEPAGGVNYCAVVSQGTGNVWTFRGDQYGNKKTFSKAYRGVVKGGNAINVAKSLAVADCLYWYLQGNTALVCDLEHLVDNTHQSENCEP